jgi:hypothetical protein
LGTISLATIKVGAAIVGYSAMATELGICTTPGTTTSHVAKIHGITFPTPGISRTAGVVDLSTNLVWKDNNDSKQTKKKY